VTEDNSLDRLFQLTIEQVENPEIQAELERILAGDDDIEIPEAALEENEDSDDMNIGQIIKDLNFAGKIKLAMKGNKTARSLLLKESNKQIQLFVLSNPRLTEGEIVELSKNSNVDESLLRRVSKESAWMKNYAVKYNLVGNPKTPIDVSLKWVKFLKDKDMRLLAKSKNIPQVVSIQCKKIIEKRN